MLKAVAFNGSPRKDGNTETLLKMVLEEIKSEGISTELIQVGGKAIRGCSACMKCRKNMNTRCAIDSDELNSYIEKALKANIIIIGSPTYFADVSSETKALIDRLGFVARANGLLKDKIGAAVVAVRRAGAVHVFNTINNFFMINSMLVVGSTYWNLGFGKAKGDVQKDSEAVENMKDLGKRIALLSKKIYAGS